MNMRQAKVQSEKHRSHSESTPCMLWTRITGIDLIAADEARVGPYSYYALLTAPFRGRCAFFLSCTRPECSLESGRLPWSHSTARTPPSTSPWLLASRLRSNQRCMLQYLILLPVSASFMWLITAPRAHGRFQSRSDFAWQSPVKPCRGPRQAFCS